ncbi:MAG: YebC/PmpR family DNA-binding transcriptional regulator [Candidatus Cloacimonetes bacterium 4572_65]|nr:MAG: YebC/PmpR family DNA-binding transcriptional regulator [Candidatus Cloacimonetes bacterium 4572_65]
MSGHNKWSSIKHKKGAADSKRAKVFTKLGKEIVIAARQGGGDLEANPRLRTAVSAARGQNMPKDNIERAIKRGTGEIEGVSYEEFTYEGYGHGGVAIIVDVTTDNKNRTVAEVRHAFSKYGGSMAESGSVSWNFELKGYFCIAVDGRDEDDFMMEALEAGAEDIKLEGDMFEVYTVSSDLHEVIGNMEEAGFEIEHPALVKIPKTTVKADDVAEKLFRLLEKLDDLDDVQKVWANFEVSDEVMAKLGEE